MEILGASFSGKIEDLLLLESYDVDSCYNISELEMFKSISNLDTWGMDSLEAESKLTEREIVRDLTNDGRSRQLSILMYEDEPFAMYQCIGRGNFENEIIFNKEIYIKFIKDYIAEFMDAKNNIQVVDLNYEYEVYNYDYGVFIVEDNSVTSICKTKL